MCMARPLCFTCLVSTPQFLHLGEVISSTVPVKKVRFKEIGYLSKLTEANFKDWALPHSLPSLLPTVTLLPPPSPSPLEQKGDHLITVTSESHQLCTYSPHQEGWVFVCYFPSWRDHFERSSLSSQSHFSPFWKMNILWSLRLDTILTVHEISL